MNLSCKNILLLIFILGNFTKAFPISSSDMLQSIRYQLPLLSDSPTGAIDSDGNYTKNSGNGLNCSGFAKWIVDGFYTPLTSNDEPKYIYHFKHLGKNIPKNVAQKTCLSMKIAEIHISVWTGREILLLNWGKPQDLL